MGWRQIYATQRQAIRHRMHFNECAIQRYRDWLKTEADPQKAQIWKEGIDDKRREIAALERRLKRLQAAPAATSGEPS